MIEFVSILKNKDLNDIKANISTKFVEEIRTNTAT